MKKIQNYENHVRWHPPFHYVLMPLLLVNLIFAIVRVVQYFDVDRIAYLILAVALILLGLLARINALKAQDRTKRLEERLRYREVLPKNLADKTHNLRTSQIIALRFASDEELPELIERALNGEFKKPDEIKRAVKNWRGDYLRV